MPAKKAATDKKETMKQVYGYIVCMICVAAGIIFLYIGIYGIVKIAAPEFTLHNWEKISSYTSFKTDWEMKENTPELSDEELKIRWEDNKEVSIRNQVHQGWLDFIAVIIYLVIAVPLFIIHWRMVRKLRKKKD